MISVDTTNEFPNSKKHSAVGTWSVERMNRQPTRCRKQGSDKLANHFLPIVLEFMLISRTSNLTTLVRNVESLVFLALCDLTSFALLPPALPGILRAFLNIGSTGQRLLSVQAICEILSRFPLMNNCMLLLLDTCFAIPLNLKEMYKFSCYTITHTLMVSLHWRKNNHKICKTVVVEHCTIGKSEIFTV